MQIISLYLFFSMLAVLWFDVTRYTIPNWLNGLLVAVYPLAVLLSPAPVQWVAALAGMAAVFLAGYVVFAMKWMGGGDIKLITACALWVGLPHLMEFILLFALLGGIFSVVLWTLRKALPFAYAKPLPRLLRQGEPVPYGVAIAVGFLILIVQGRISVPL